MGLRLAEGDRVCIVGGGPAGSFAALHLLALSRQHGLDLEVVIFEPRKFSNSGPSGCSGCAGVLSSRLLNGLDALELTLPEEIIQSELHAYAAYLNGDIVRIKQPNPTRRIVSVYRGGGPRMQREGSLASFDKYLITQACARGARLIPSSVRAITYQNTPVISTVHGKMNANLLVLATGVNSTPPISPDIGYYPPKTELMAQDEILRPASWPKDQVSAFFKRPPGLVFGALVPKGKYLSVSLLGREMNRDFIPRFFEEHGLEGNNFSIPGSMCGCTPRIAVGLSPRYFGDRWVAVGDAVVTRLYKDGIGSAFYTSQAAVRTAIERGISGRDFRKGYAPFTHQIARDNLYGRMLFRLWDLTLSNPWLLEAWKKTLALEDGLEPGRRVHNRFLWGMVTGDEMYRDLFWLFLNRSALEGLWSGLRMPY